MKAAHVEIKVSLVSPDGKVVDAMTSMVPGARPGSERAWYEAVLKDVIVVAARYDRKRK